VVWRVRRAKGLYRLIASRSLLALRSREGDRPGALGKADSAILQGRMNGDNPFIKLCHDKKTPRCFCSGHSILIPHSN